MKKNKEFENKEHRHSHNSINENESKSHHSHEHEHDHEHDHDSVNVPVMIIRLVFSSVLLIVGTLFFKENNIINLILLLIAYLVSGYDIIFEAVENTIHLELLDEEFLMFIASAGAFAINERFEAVIVIVLFQLGEMLQGLAVSKSKSDISSLLALKPDYANLKVGNEIKTVAPEEVNINDIIVIYPGEKIPLDGTVIKGASSVNTSSLTGESMPVDVSLGDRILSGCINGGSELEVSVDTIFSESTVSRILDLLENSSENKSSSESFIHKFAKIYTPIVVGLALLICFLPPLFTMKESGYLPELLFWLHKGLSFLVVSCPCALVISIPLSYFGGIGGASKQGILVKGGNFLDALTEVKTIVWDKTGTLTEGRFKVIKTESFTNSFTEDDLLTIAAHLECHSSHPIAKSLLDEYGQEPDLDKISDVKVIDGLGIEGNYLAFHILIGNEKIMRDVSGFTPGNDAGTYCYVAIDGKYAGYILIADKIKDDTINALKSVKSLGVTNNIMLTGDSESVAAKVATEIGIDSYYSKCLPEDKVSRIEELIAGQNNSDKLAFVGDGMNDAPVISRADVGIAMGAYGSDAAIEAADIVIMNDSPSNIATAVKIARKTKKIATENIVFSIAVKVIIMILITLGISNMYMAVFADVGVCLIAILNASRTLKS